jgi:hypothetical protein
MYGRNQPSLNPDDLDRVLIDALNVEPSSEFRSRVRGRVMRESMRSRWTATAPLVVAASLAFVAIGFTLSRDVVDERPVQRIATGADVMLPSVSEPMTTNTSPVIRPTLRSVAKRRLPTDVSQPQVLLSASEQAGVRLLFESAASGSLQLPPEMLQDLSLPIVRVAGTTEGDNQ